MRHSRHELAELAVTVVCYEGPIHIEEVARRVREALGVGRTGRRILKSVSDSLQQASRRGTIVRDGEFWSPRNSLIDSPRSRRNATVSLRRADRIAPEEYRVAIKAVLRATVAATRPELTVEIARVFGFDRTGSDLARVISEHIDGMIEGGEIEDTGERLRLTDA